MDTGTLLIACPGWLDTPIFPGLGPDAVIDLGHAVLASASGVYAWAVWVPYTCGRGSLDDVYPTPQHTTAAADN